MNHPVVFLLLAGKLVLFDLSVQVVFAVGAEHQPVLRPALHGLGIDIVAGLGITHKPTPLLPEPEVLDCLVIGGLVMLANHRGEIDFGPGDVKKALLPGHSPRLL